VRPRQWEGPLHDQVTGGSRSLAGWCGHDGPVLDGGQSAERVLSSASVAGRPSRGVRVHARTCRRPCSPSPPVAPACARVRLPGRWTGPLNGALGLRDGAPHVPKLGAYEASKVEADVVIQGEANRLGLPWTIANPSTVSGVGATGESDQFLGSGRGEAAAQVAHQGGPRDTQLHVKRPLPGSPGRRVRPPARAALPELRSLSRAGGRTARPASAGPACLDSCWLLRRRRQRRSRVRSGVEVQRRPRVRRPARPVRWVTAPHAESGEVDRGGVVQSFRGATGQFPGGAADSDNSSARSLSDCRA